MKVNLSLRKEHKVFIPKLCYRRGNEKSFTLFNVVVLWYNKFQFGWRIRILFISLVCLSSIYTLILFQVSPLELLDVIHIIVEYFYQQNIERPSTSLHFYYLTVNMQHDWYLNRMNAFVATPLSIGACNGLAFFANSTIESNRSSFIKESWIHGRFTFSY